MANASQIAYVHALYLKYNTIPYVRQQQALGPTRLPLSITYTLLIMLEKSSYLVLKLSTVSASTTSLRNPFHSSTTL